MGPSCHPPAFFDSVLDDPTLVRRLVEAGGPYLPVQRYFRNDAEYRAASAAGSPGKPMIVAPNFRGDWAYDEPLVAGVEPILHHEGFRRAAGEMFSCACVEPFSVYANITWQLPFDQGGGHVDVPEFRGIHRGEQPTWLLSMMGHSGLFEAERVEIATAVAWFYAGRDGGFTCWPDGPDRPPRVHEGDISNTAVLGDNDRMFHRVRPVGRREDGLPRGLTLDTRLERRGGDRWAIARAGETLAEMPFEALRVSISWKARVFRDVAALRRYRDHTDDLTLDEVFERFYADLERRGVAFERPAAPLDDPALVDVLAATYVRAPSVFEARAA